MAEPIYGTERNEVIQGTDGDDVIYSYSGYDTLDGGNGSDVYIVTAEDFGGRYVNFYQDSGTFGVDVIRAETAGIDIGLGDGFSLADSGIEIIDGLEGSRIVGEGENQRWDFTGVQLLGIAGIFAGGGADNVVGTEQADLIDGGEGHDVLDGGRGRDTLFGGDGNDILLGGNGRDFLYSGAGYDIMDGGQGSDVYLFTHDNKGWVDDIRDSGTRGDDKAQATADNVHITLMNGFGPDSGIEIISSGGFDNVRITGTDGAEIWDFTGIRLSGIAMIEGFGGHDHITGNAQNNRIDGGADHDRLFGMDGHDQLFGGDGNDVIEGGNGRDKIWGGDGHDILDGGAGADTYWFNASPDHGFDIITDSGTDDGRDKILASEDDAVIALHNDFSSANGIEVISARKHSGVIILGDKYNNSWDFSDTILRKIAHIDAGAGHDVVFGSKGHDTILGGEGFDTLHGGNGRDKLYGGADADVLFGDAGNDQLFGEAGNDRLVGGEGRDVLTGGEGFDTFVFEDGSYRDRIVDFTAMEDMIDVTAFDTRFEDLRIIDTKLGARVYFDADDFVTLEGWDADDVSADMFIF